MNIHIVELLNGAKEAKGVAVIIDVFRAFSVEAYLFEGGVGKIIPVADINLAYKYKKQNPEIILVGERGGKICDGFDFGNSPSQIDGENFVGKTVVHTTSAGTQGLFGATKAEKVMGASLANARATAEYILKGGFSEVTLVCMGLASSESSEEDVLCAKYIKSILEGNPIPLKEEIESLKFTSGAKFFDPEQNGVFPENDFYLCTKPDIFPFAMCLETDENGERYMKKVKVGE